MPTTPNPLDALYNKWQQTQKDFAAEYRQNESGGGWEQLIPYEGGHRWSAIDTGPEGQGSLNFRGMSPTNRQQQGGGATLDYRPALEKAGYLNISPQNLAQIVEDGKFANGDEALKYAFGPGKYIKDPRFGIETGSLLYKPDDPNRLIQFDSAKYPRYSIRNKSGTSFGDVFKGFLFDTGGTGSAILGSILGFSGAFDKLLDAFGGTGVTNPQAASGMTAEQLMGQGAMDIPGVDPFVNPATGLPWDFGTQPPGPGTVPGDPFGGPPDVTPPPGTDAADNLYNPPPGVTPPPAPVPDIPTVGWPPGGGATIDTSIMPDMPDWLAKLLPPGTTLGSLLGNLLSGGISAYASNQQADRYGALAREQMAAEKARYDDLVRRENERFGILTGREDTAIAKAEALRQRGFDLGAPSRTRYEATYRPGFTMSSDPGYQDALDQAAKGTLHGLSIAGNPAGSPNAWAASLSDLFKKTAYPAMQDYRKLNAETGGYAAYNQAGASIPGIQSGLPTTATAGSNIGTQAGANINLAALGQQSNFWNSLGATAEQIFNPQPSSAQTLAQLAAIMNRR